MNETLFRFGFYGGIVLLLLMVSGPGKRLRRWLSCKAGWHKWDRFHLQSSIWNTETQAWEPEPVDLERHRCRCQRCSAEAKQHGWGDGNPCKCVCCGGESHLWKRIDSSSVELVGLNGEQRDPVTKRTVVYGKKDWPVHSCERCNGRAN